MIQVIYIISFAMAVANLFKKYIPAAVVPFATIFLAVALNLINAVLFGGSLLDAGKEAFIQAGIFIGMFAGSDAIRSSSTTPLKEVR